MDIHSEFFNNNNNISRQQKEFGNLVLQIVKSLGPILQNFRTASAGEYCFIGFGMSL